MTTLSERAAVVKYLREEREGYQAIVDTPAHPGDAAYAERLVAALKLITRAIEQGDHNPEEDYGDYYEDRITDQDQTILDLETKLTRMQLVVAVARQLVKLTHGTDLDDAPYHLYREKLDLRLNDLARAFGWHGEAEGWNPPEEL